MPATRDRTKQIGFEIDEITRCKLERLAWSWKWEPNERAGMSGVLRSLIHAEFSRRNLKLREE